MMHVPTEDYPPEVRASDYPPEVRASLHRIVVLAKSRDEISDADFMRLFETAIIDLMLHLSQHASAVGYAEGLRQGIIRGRRKGRGLPEIAKPRGRPKSVDRILRETGLSWEKINLW